MGAPGNTTRLMELCRDHGAPLVGVGELREEVKSGLLSKEETRGLGRAISIAVRLSDRVLDGVVDQPTRLYLHHYRQVNYLLDHLALLVTGWIQGEGYNALPVAASQVIDWEKGRGHLSHRHVAVRAGLGWIGRNNLLVTPSFGARARLVTVLTDMPLVASELVEEDCGSCKACMSVCPASAIKERPEDFDLESCQRQVRHFRDTLRLGHDICGICVRACPGKDRLGT